MTSIRNLISQILKFIKQCTKAATEPSKMIEELYQLRQARLVSSMLLVMIPFALVGLFAGAPRGLMLILIILLMVFYGLSRTRYYIWAGVLSIITLSSLPIINTVTDIDPTPDRVTLHLLWLILPILIGSLVFSLRGTIITILTVTGAISLLPLIRRDISYFTIIVPVTFMTLSGILVSLTTKIRYQYQQEIKTTKHKLEISRTQMVSTTIELEQTEQALQKSELHYRALFENNQDLVFIVGLDGTLRFANPAAVDVLGYELEELEGLSNALSVLISPEEQEKSKGRLTELSAGGVFPIYTRIFRKKDGTDIPMEVNVSLISDENGTPQHLQAILRVITERVKIEKALKESEEKYRNLTDSARVGIASTQAADGKILYVNDTLLSMLEYDSLEEMQAGGSLTKYKNPEDRKRLMTIMQKDGKLDNFETEILSKNGTVVNVLVSGSIDGGIFNAIVVDITERKKTEERLRLKNEIIANMSEGVYLVQTRDAKIVYTNPKFEKMFGYQAGEMLGKHVSIVNAPTDKDPMEVANKIMQDLEEKGSWDGKVKNVTKDGAPFWCHASVSSFDHPEFGNVWISIHSDITEQVLAEEKIKYAIEVAELANRTKSIFLTNMSHEIRTPLNGIIGMTNLMLLEELSPLQKKYMGTVDASGKILLSLINDILDFSKIEANQLSIESNHFHFQHSIEEAVEIVSPLADGKKIEINLIISKDIPETIIGDKFRINQILINLLNNAVKFTDLGEITVSVTGHKLVQNQVELYFSVTDTGIGISQEYIEKIFDAFHQIDSSMTRNQGGTGLGLPISKRLIELMDGRIWVESEYGEGSTFHFTIIVETTKRNNSDDSEDYEISPHQSLDLIRPLRILLAEDNKVNQHVVLHSLRKLGYTADTANNGLEVLQKIKDKVYDVILMDVMMPEMDGLATTRYIRKQQSLEEQIYIIALTAHAMKEHREQCLAAGMDAYIVKPFELATLSSELEKSIEKLKLRR